MLAQRIGLGANEKGIFLPARRTVSLEFRHHWHFPMQRGCGRLLSSTQKICYSHVIPSFYSLSLSLYRKDAKKVSKLEAQIPYHEGRGNQEEVAKIKEQIEAIWEKAREAVTM